MTDSGGYAHLRCPLVIAELVQALDDGVVIAWAIEEQLDAGVDGRSYLVPIHGDGVWTISIGAGEQVVEVDITGRDVVADGHALLVDDRVTSTQDWGDRVLWCGPNWSTGWQSVVTDTGLRLVPAISVEAVGKLIAGSVESIRPDVNVVHDPGWRLHDHPVAQLLAERSHGPQITVDDDPSISFTHEAFAEWMALDLDRDLHLLTARSADIEELTRFEEAARWTDGTVLVEDD